MTAIHREVSSAAGDAPALAVRDLVVDYRTRRGPVHAVRSVSLEVAAGESLALIGESGSGKTTLGLALVRLLPESARVAAGEIRFATDDGTMTDIARMGNGELRRFRWQECAMVFQSALNALNPVMRVRDHFADTAKAHRGARGDDGRRIDERAADHLRLVQLDHTRVLGAFPHELSGGMRQRVMIGLGLLLRPRVLILDEPTTALDVLTQRAIIEVMRELKAGFGFAMVFVSHDLSLAAELADRVATMYAGRIVEIGPVEATFYRPHHPYTVGLLRAVPKLSGGQQDLESIPGSPPDLIDLPSGCPFNPRCAHATDRCRTEDPPLVEVERGHQTACWHSDEVFADWQAGRHTGGGAALRPERGDKSGRDGRIGSREVAARGLSIELQHVHQTYKAGRQTIRAVDDVSLVIEPGQTLCLVGESGCGKSTTGRIVAGLLTPSEGRLLYGGRELSALPAAERTRFRRAVQIIQQDPYASLNPTRSIAQVLGAPLRHHKIVRSRAQLRARMTELLELVGLTPAADFLLKYPHQLSGGQRQRVAVARALTVEPEFIVADEPVSMVDVSLRVSLLNMLLRLQRELGVTFLFVTHDLAVAKHFAWNGRIGVMYLGRLVEVGPTQQVVADPIHPYTRALIAALPEADPVVTRTKERIRLRSPDLPSLLNLPDGCTFHPRCPLFEPGLCDGERPPEDTVVLADRTAACFVMARELGAGARADT